MSEQSNGHHKKTLSGPSGTPLDFLIRPPTGCNVSATTLIYCDECERDQPLAIKPMVSDPENNNEVWGDLLCGACGLVLQTLTVPTEGEYEFVEVRDVRDSDVSAKTVIYCNVCDRNNPMVVTPMASNPVNNNKISGNLLCGECGAVLASLTVPTAGEYEFVKVRDRA